MERQLKDIESVLSQLVNEANAAYNKIRAAKKTFVSLSYFLTGSFKDYFEYITPQEEDLLGHFRKLSPEMKQLYVKEIKNVADTLKPPVIKHHINASLSLEELKEGMKISADGKNVYKICHSHTHGYCYIGVDVNWNGYYKIGRTFDPTCRSRMSHSINPNFKIIYRTKDYYINAGGLEEKIHNRLSNNRFENNNCTEWFKLSDKELEQLIKDYDFIRLEELGIK